ncbi:MAG TPA: hypothetical protein VKQ36_02275, partial [Ktedonobacterales bacterium]|nr:hypothetical protein [Ktedonobacterales bacterium]
SWLLTRVMRVQRGILLTGDNGFYDQMAQAMDSDSEWARLRARAFGIGPQGASDPAPTLREQVIAGLRLYALTASLLSAVLIPEDAPLIQRTVRLIEATLDAE